MGKIMQFQLNNCGRKYGKLFHMVIIRQMMQSDLLRPHSGLYMDL